MRNASNGGSTPFRTPFLPTLPYLRRVFSFWAGQIVLGTVSCILKRGDKSQTPIGDFIREGATSFVSKGFDTLYATFSCFLHAWRVYSLEVQRTDPSRLISKVPANGPCPFPSSSPLTLIKTAVTALAVLLFCSPLQAQQATRWGSSGEFNLTGGFTSSSQWSHGQSNWQASDAFERSAPSITVPQEHTFELRSGSEPLDQLLDLIASAEAGPSGYDAIHMSATRLPPDPPTQLTLRQIYEWIDQTPGQHHAIGRYQFIPSTLARLVEAEGISLDQKFTPQVQRQLAAHLVFEADYQAFLNGRTDADTFMDNLARIWAGLPLRNGNSAYHNYAGNRATITRATFSGVVEKIYGQ
jgi:hypothetical protein